MTKIDFYVLPEDGSLPTAVAIGRLAEKASARGHQVFIQTKDAQEALELDEALWAFRPSSFARDRAWPGASHHWTRRPTNGMR